MYGLVGPTSCHVSLFRQDYHLGDTGDVSRSLEGVYELSSDRYHIIYSSLKIYFHRVFNLFSSCTGCVS